MDFNGINLSKLYLNEARLSKYDEVLRFFHQNRDIIKNKNIEKKITVFLNVLKPILANLDGTLSKSTIFNEYNIIRILKQHKTEDWEIFQDDLKKLYIKLNQNKILFIKKDFEILNDIGDAINLEYSNLFRKIQVNRL